MLSKTYKIKMEDKAAFLNKVEKAGITVDFQNIKDNELDKTFTVTFTNPNDINAVSSILKSSPKINRIKEIIRNVVREELKKNLGN